MKTGIVAGIAGAMVSGLVWAQGPPRGPSDVREGPMKRGGTHERRDVFAEMLRGSDTDKSGSISFEEFTAGGRVAELPEDVQRKFFERFDKNGDGQIRKDEIPKPKWGRGGPDRGMMHRGPHDPNGDGRVSLDEFRKNPRIARLDPARQEELFRQMDRNGDQFLDREDRMGRGPGRDGEGPGPRGPMQPPRIVQELDADKDGAVSFEEFRKGPRMQNVGEDRAEDMFEALDRNDDGKLSPEDFKGERTGPGMGPGKRPGGPGKERGVPGKGPRGPGGAPKPGRPEGDQGPPRPQKPAPVKPTV